MSYNIFISHTNSDKKIASELNRFINNEFKGDIKTYFAINDIKAGDKWKNEIKENLEKCDAIISLITKNSKSKPWIFIEWSAYWIADKQFYVLISDDVVFLDLIHPMQDSQLIRITDLDSIKGLIQRLSEDSNHKIHPYEKAEDLIISFKSAIYQQELEFNEKSYSKYENNIDLLPIDDIEKEKIALYFLEKSNLDTFKKIVNKLKTDRIKHSIVRGLLKEAKTELAFEIADNIRSAETQSEIIIEAIELKYEDSPRIKLLIEAISSKSQAQLRSIAQFIAECGMEDTELFNYILESFTNMAELRKIGYYFISNNRFDTKIFDDIINKLLTNNRAELRKVGSCFVDNDIIDNSVFISLITKLASKNQKEASKLLIELKNKDLIIFHQIIDTGIITDSEARSLIEE